VKSKHQILVHVSPDTIHKRIMRKKVVHHHRSGHISTFALIEPTLVLEIILQMARIRQYLTPSTGLCLANSLIDVQYTAYALAKFI